MIKDIAFVAYPSENIATTREWYEKHLGLNFTGPYVENGVEMYNEANIGPACFALMHPAYGQQPAGSGHGCAFEVEDMEATVARLRDAGCKVNDIYPTPVCKISGLRDPEGNQITLHQRTAPSN
jgi:predicted enzyme related to lactoylglutathione lyase